MWELSVYASREDPPLLTPRHIDIVVILD